MRVVRDPTIINQCQPLHLAIGMFDGVHLGHRAVIESAVHAAKARGGQSAVLTFDPHPSRIIRPESPTLLLQTPQQKEACIEKLGVDILVWQTFTMELASVGAEDYVARLKARMPTLESIHVGENFRFGKGRSGDITTLLAKAAQLGIHVISIERVRYDGEPISSSRIRSIVAEGRIDYAGDLLGYDYCCEGVVEPGAKLGRKLGFPTLNIRWAPPCKPRLGVYLVSVRRAGGGTSVHAVANYGLRPTVSASEDEPLLELHVLGDDCPFDGGNHLHVDWLKFLRPEKKFSSIDNLKARIAIDCEDAARIAAELTAR